jgi:hypothetical protein
MIENAGSDTEGIHLIYKIDGKPNDLDAFELARVLDSFGYVLQESYRIAHPDEGEMSVRVKPFESGSFIMDLVLTVRQDPTVLFLLSNLDIFKYAKATLEAFGLIKGALEKGVSLLELLRNLKNGKPTKIEQTGPDTYEYHSGDGSVIPVNSTVNALYSSPVINNYTFNIVAPAEHDTVQSVFTYLKNAPNQTRVTISKEDVQAVRAYSEPDAIGKVEILEDTTVRLLNPKSGSYGQTTGTWSFTIAGTKRVLKAKIADKDFLARFAKGAVRFYQGDRLKARLRERQITDGKRTKMEYEIVEVLEYHQSHSTVRQY